LAQGCVLSALEAGTTRADAPAPFLLEKQNASEQTLQEDPIEEEILLDMETNPTIWSLELLYRESDSAHEQPIAMVRLVGETKTGVGVTNSLTSRCLHFNDLDSEVRRLQAQLEDIRVRAKKKFYKAHAAAASA
jgi:hypothetical protein